MEQVALIFVDVPPAFRNTTVRAVARTKPVSNVAEQSCVEPIQEEKELQLVRQGMCALKLFKVPVNSFFLAQCI